MINARNLIILTMLFSLSTGSLRAQTSDTISPYSSIHYRGVATLDLAEQSFTSQFNFVNVIDSFFYLQLNVSGLEAGRMLATPEHIVFINKLQKNYYEGDYSFSQKLAGIEVDFYTLQAIFNGTPVNLPEEVNLSYKKDSISAQYPFFNKLTCEFDNFSLTLDIKKVTFHTTPEVSATIPKNYTPLPF